jgi:hypothetical protein
MGLGIGSGLGRMDDSRYLSGHNRPRDGFGVLLAGERLQGEVFPFSIGARSRGVGAHVVDAVLPRVIVALCLFTYAAKSITHVLKCGQVNTLCLSIQEICRGRCPHFD